MLGFLRETTEAAKKAGVDKQTGLPRTGLNEYLEIIFPGVKWIHDKPFGKYGNEYITTRPDYRNDELRLIIEFDGVQHYTSPEQIFRDNYHTELYREAGYKVVRIPYFIQLTKSAVKQLFNIEVEQELFPDNVPSLGKGNGDPSYLCTAGLFKMAMDFQRFPDQYKINIEHLKKLAGDDQFEDYLHGYTLLKKEYESL